MKMQKEAADIRGIEFYLRSISAVYVAFSHTKKQGGGLKFFFFILDFGVLVRPEEVAQ